MILGLFYIGYILSTGAGFSWLWFLFWIFFEYILILFIVFVVLGVSWLSSIIEDWKWKRRLKNKSDKE